ncbi:MAG: DMT family transporter [Kangiellaceae bacterium]
MSIWISFTLLAAFMQAVRTAGQKQLSLSLSAIATTLVRFLFAVPLVWLYLFVVAHFTQLSLPTLSGEFVQSALFAAASQILATALMIKAFDYKNFAVATSLAKTEAVLTALIGVIAFNATLSGIGWFSVLIGVVGVIILSKSDLSYRSLIKTPAAFYGVGAGAFFALSTLWIRQASLSLDTHLMLSAAFTLAFMVSVQTAVIILYLLFRQPNQLKLIKRHWKIASFVGFASMLGSVGWFTAASYQDAAYVKALGQIEFFFTLIITRKFFKEPISSKEYLGMLLILMSVIILLIFA